MPVATRTMKKNLIAANYIGDTTAPSPTNKVNLFTNSNTSEENLFIQKTKSLLFQCECAGGMEAKMRITLEIFKNTNSNLENLLNNNQMKWIKYAACVYSKTTEFYNDMMSGKYNKIPDKNLVKTHFEEFMKTRNFLASYFTNLKKTSPLLIDMNDKFISQAMREIEDDNSAINNIVTSRPRRSVSRVDYTGMDTIEPESEDDYITNIWYDESVWYDSDYVPEEDDEDDDEEDDEDEDDGDDDDNDTVDDVIQAAVRVRRTGRNYNPPNYAGMDMGEDDEGTVSINIVKWNNRVPTHKWVKYPLSTVNELFDEEWTPSCGV
jgi:hypothetical protein